MKLIFLLLSFLLSFALADDWPQWFGPEHDGVWRETGIIDKFPDGGPKVLWRTPVNRGYAGPSVVGDRVFVMDRKALDTQEARQRERELEKNRETSGFYVSTQSLGK